MGGPVRSTGFLVRIASQSRTKVFPAIADRGEWINFSLREDLPVYCWTRRTFRWIALSLFAFVGLLAFSTQASAQILNPSTTTVQASPSSAAVGQQVVLTATVSCPGFTPGGLGVTFFDGPNLLDTVPLDASGQATYTTTFTTTGSHTITAAYNGDSNCAASNNTTTVQISTAPPPPPPPTPCGCGSINIDIRDLIKIRIPFL